MIRTALVTGAESQLAKCLEMAGAPPGWRASYLDRSELDITDLAQADAVFAAVAPACVINTAAYTAVDLAESEPGQAWRVNAAGVANLVRCCAGSKARLIHVSTDFVFDGRQATPYAPGSETAPLGAYGASKLAGEQEIAALPAGQGVVVRTSWLYSEFGSNFVKTMLGLMGERDELAVVSDQIGCPTSAHSLAALIWRIAELAPQAGVYHWHDGGALSWFGFAREIQRLGLAARILQGAIPLRPITTAEFAAAAKRPAYSVMDRSRALAEFGAMGDDWRAELDRVIKAIGKQREDRKR